MASGIVLKPRAFFNYYVQFFETMPINNVLEFGVFEGGSIMLFALAFPKCRIVGIDVRPPSDIVLQHIHDLGLQDRVKIYYNTSQSDKEMISDIIASEFGEEELGLVIDDASHNYYHSRRTFELTFGRLAPGGSYCLARKKA